MQSFLSPKISEKNCSTPLSPMAAVLLISISREIEYFFCFFRDLWYDKICIPLKYNAEYSNVIQLFKQILLPGLFL